MIRHIYIFILLTVVSLSSYAQDPQFTQFYAAPLYLNPGFTGAIPDHRVVLNSRAQWVGLPRTYVTYAASYDHNFSKQNSGVGFLAMADKSGTGVLTSTTVSALYSYLVKLNSSWVIRTGLQFSYVSRNLDFYKLTFGDQLDNSGTQGIATAEQFDRNARVNYFDFNTGAIIHNRNVWLGTSVRHLNHPNQSLAGVDKSQLPLYLSVHGGAKIHLYQGKLQKSYGAHRERSITPTFNYKLQGSFQQFDMGVYLFMEPMVLGLWYRGIPIVRRTYDAAAVLIGFRLEKFTVGYSYDLTISRLHPSNTVGSHEISLSLLLGNENKKPERKRRKDYVIPCPKF